MPKALADWLTHIEGLHATSIDLGLDRIRAVYERLALGPFNCLVVSIAGTNGKGSTVACLEQLALSQQLRVGVYTSPHIVVFNERIRLNGLAVTDEQLCAAFELIEATRADSSLTYFEFTTLAALICFHQTELDCVLLEVGLGGRLDAVNIIDADIAVITSIGLDHQQWLGDTIEAIAKENAGILRAARPCVYGADPVPQAIVTQAAQLGCALFGGPSFAIESGMCAATVDASWGVTLLTPQRDAFRLEQLPRPNLVLSNAAVALQVWVLLAEQLSMSFDLDIVKRVLASVQVPGRWQSLDAQGSIILDVAHNVPAVEQLKQRLLRESDGRRVIALFGAMKDKDIPGMLKVMAPVVDTWCVLQLADPRAASLETLLTIFKDLSIECVHGFKTAEQAFALLKSTRDPKKDRWVIFGSFGMVEVAFGINLSSI